MTPPGFGPPRRLVAAGAVVLVLVAAAWIVTPHVLSGGDGDGSSARSTAPRVVTIGVLAPLTGAGGPAGAEVRAAVETAVADGT